MHNNAIVLRRAEDSRVITLAPIPEREFHVCSKRTSRDNDRSVYASLFIKDYQNRIFQNIVAYMCIR